MEVRPVNLSQVIAPPLSGSVSRTQSRGRVALSWPAASGASAYEVRYRQRGRSWTTDAYGGHERRQNYSALRRNTAYEFQIRARGNGVTYSRNWSDWSATYTAITRPPNAPTRFSVTARSAHSITVSWRPRSGARSYEVQYLRYNFAAREGERMGWQSSGRITTPFFEAPWLAADTRYMFRVRAKGDGLRNAGGMGGWTTALNAYTLAERQRPTPTPIPTPTATATPASYAPLVDPPGYALACRAPGEHGDLTRRHTVTGEDGATHVITIHIRRVPFLYLAPLATYCVQGRVTVESTDGASSLEWDARLYKRVSAIDIADAEDITDWDNMPWNDFWGLFRLPPLDANTPLEQPAQSHRCAGPCLGGTLQIGHALVGQKYIKTVDVAVQTIATIGGVSDKQEVGHHGALPQTGVLTYAEYVAGATAEIREDLFAIWDSTILDYMNTNIPRR